MNMAINNRVKVANDVELKDRLVAINRVTKVTKGGRTFSFVVNFVVGNENGIIGYGLGKASEVTAAISKGVEAAKKNLVRVPVLKGTVPHEATVKTDPYKHLGQKLLAPVVNSALDLVLLESRS